MSFMRGFEAGVLVEAAAILTVDAVLTYTPLGMRIKRLWRDRVSLRVRGLFWTGDVRSYGSTQVCPAIGSSGEGVTGELRGAATSDAAARPEGGRLPRPDRQARRRRQSRLVGAVRHR
jgi:hypothetical protein